MSFCLKGFASCLLARIVPLTASKMYTQFFAEAVMTICLPVEGGVYTSGLAKNYDQSFVRNLQAQAKLILSSALTCSSFPPLVVVCHKRPNPGSFTISGLRLWLSRYPD